MNLKDQLNAASRTKAETVNEQYKKDYKVSYKSAEFIINGIKDTLMEKVEHGEYEELANGKKHIQIEYKSVSIKYFMGLDFKIMKVISDDGRNEKCCAKYYISSQGSYDGFVKRIMEFSLEEDVSFKIVCRYETINKKYEFSPVVGCRIDSLVFESKIEFVIECSVEY